jgi:hypothetical protein
MRGNLSYSTLRWFEDYNKWFTKICKCKFQTCSILKFIMGGPRKKIDD